MSYTAAEASKILVDSRVFPTRKISYSVLSEKAKPSQYTILIPLKNSKTLAYHTNTQAFSLWGIDDMKIWKDVCASKVDMGATALKPFVQNGYVIESSADEKNEIRENYERFRFDNTNMLLTIAPTLSCNFGCEYCFQGLDKPTIKMKPDVKTALVRMFEEKISSTAGIFVTWYGGEPLMDRKSIYSLSEKFIQISENAKKPYSAFIVTNGYFLDAKVAQALLDCKISMAQITIDGDKKAHDSRRHLTSGRPTYDRILQNIKNVINETEFKITVRVNVDTTNSQHITSLLEDLARCKFTKPNNLSVYFAPVEAITSECVSCLDDTMKKTDYSTLEVQMIELAAKLGLSGVSRPPKYMGTCTAVRPNGMVVTPNGDIHKCWDSVMNRNLRVGSVFEYSEMYNNPRQKKWMEWSPFDNPTCSSCKLLPSCMGACAFKFIHAEKTHGEAGALPCPSWKFNFAEKLFLRAKRMGVVIDEDWDAELSPTITKTGSKTGERHTFKSIDIASEKYKVSSLEIA